MHKSPREWIDIYIIWDEFSTLNKYEPNIAVYPEKGYFEVNTFGSGEPRAAIAIWRRPNATSYHVFDRTSLRNLVSLIRESRAYENRVEKVGSLIGLVSGLPRLGKKGLIREIWKALYPGHSIEEIENLVSFLL